MNFKEIYAKTKQMLLQAGVASSAFDALCLFEHFFGFGRSGIVLNEEKIPDEKTLREFWRAVEQRVSGRPLQYIIGTWSFMDFEFRVREGVLIPRDDTAVLVQAALKLTQDVENPVVSDLCAGSGAVAVAYAKYNPKSKVYALEKFETPYKTLCENILLNNAKNVLPENADVLADFDKYEDSFFDLIMSNPPYVETKEIETLQAEVRREPFVALNGGSDGLDFYRGIVKDWTNKLKSGGIIAFEVGETQHRRVADILEKSGFSDIEFFEDMQKIKRVVAGRKKFK